MKAVRDFLEEAYGKASKTRREEVLEHEMYEGIYATGFFEKGRVISLKRLSATDSASI